MDTLEDVVRELGHSDGRESDARGVLAAREESVLRDKLRTALIDHETYNRGLYMYIKNNTEIRNIETCSPHECGLLGYKRNESRSKLKRYTYPM